jgi:hypothetical protein
MIIEGPRWYRMRVRALGPLVALGPPLVWGTISWLVLWGLSDGLSSAIGLIGVISSAPVLLLVGAPFGEEGRYPVAVGASVAVWAVLGWWAARRATRVPVAGWPEFWREYTWLAVGVVAGVVLALGSVSLVYGEAFW